MVEIAPPAALITPIELSCQAVATELVTSPGGREPPAGIRPWSSAMTQASTLYPPGARILVRDEEWLVRTCARPSTTATDHARSAPRSSSATRRRSSSPSWTPVELLEPEDTVLVPDDTPRFAGPACSWRRSCARRRCRRPSAASRWRTASCWTRSPYQQRPAELALSGPPARASSSPTSSASARPWRSASSWPS